MRKNEDLKEFGELVKDSVKPIKELVEVIRNKVDHQELYLVTTAGNVKSVKEQQSVMNEKLDVISKDLNNPKTGLKRINERMDALWDQVVKITADMEGVTEKLDSHSSVLKRIESNLEYGDADTKKLDRRLNETESKLGIVPSPELTIL